MPGSSPDIFDPNTRDPNGLNTSAANRMEEHEGQQIQATRLQKLSRWMNQVVENNIALLIKQSNYNFYAVGQNIGMQIAESVRAIFSLFEVFRKPKKVISSVNSDPQPEQEPEPPAPRLR